MKQVVFNALNDKIIVDTDTTAINRIILTTKTIDGQIHYYWLDATNYYYNISIPTLYELTKDEYIDHTK